MPVTYLAACWLRSPPRAIAASKEARKDETAVGGCGCNRRSSVPANPERENVSRCPSVDSLDSGEA
jgi:hypothetical protein